MSGPSVFAIGENPGTGGWLTLPMQKTGLEKAEESLLFIVATPIGNLEDITLRALRVLGEVDLVAAEDTRSARRLLGHFGIKKTVLSYFDPKEEAKSREILARLVSGARVALISEAGTPGLSDPGYRLIRGAIDAGIRIVPIPGASAVLAALVVSGLPTHNFVFEGFLPPRAGPRKKKLVSLSREERTLVLFESPRRAARTLGEIGRLWGQRRMALVRELTKIHETVLRGTVSEVADRIKGGPLKGEVVLVIEGCPGSSREAEPLSPEGIDDLRRRLKLSRMEAIKLAAELSGRPKREIYGEYHASRSRR